METIRYDFSDLEKAMSDLKKTQNSTVLNNIKRELNKFFKDSECAGVLYTKNTDKLFFGMCVMPTIPDDIVMNTVLGDKSKNRISRYFIEIDSKLIDLGFTSRELVAMLLHEIGHVVNDSKPLEEVQNATHVYLSKTDDTANCDRVTRNIQLFRMAICDAIRSSRSLFKKTDEEIIADEFSVRCGYGRDLETAYKKIVRNVGRLNNNATNKLVSLQWTIRIYKDLGIRRVYAIKTLNKSLQLTGSELQKRNVKNAKDQLNTVDNETIVQEASIVFKKASDFYKRLKFKGIRGLEDDLYEFNLKAKNVDEHDDALIIIRQINTRMAIIEDYMATEKLSEKERERWSDLLNKYRMIREEVSKKTTYDEKFYGLFVEMPSIKSRYEI